MFTPSKTNNAEEDLIIDFFTQRGTGPSRAVSSKDLREIAGNPSNFGARLTGVKTKIELKSIKQDGFHSYYWTGKIFTQSRGHNQMHANLPKIPGTWTQERYNALKAEVQALIQARAAEFFEEPEPEEEVLNPFDVFISELEARKAS